MLFWKGRLLRAVFICVAHTEPDVLLLSPTHNRYAGAVHAHARHLDAACGCGNLPQVPALLLPTVQDGRETRGA